MPYNCAAYGCNNTTDNCKEKNISFHGFPLNNERYLKLWLINMKRGNFIPSKHSKLCSEHFEESDFIYQKITNKRFIKVDSIPTKFNFVTRSNGLKESIFKSNAPVLEYPVHQDLNTTPMEMNLIDMVNPAQFLSNTYSESESSEFEETFENTEFTTYFVQEDVEPNPNLSSFPSSVISASDDSEIGTGKEEANTQSAALPESLNLQHELQSDFKVENITDDYTMCTVTGFTVKAFHAVFEFLCLENLLKKNRFPLSPVNQFFLMVVYLKTELNQLCLSFLYKIPQFMVSRIFNNTGIIVHKQLKKFDIWPSREFVRDKTPSSFSKKFPNCRVIVDCVEFQIQNPTSAVTQEETLNHKNFYSMKGLIGITPSGTVSFISDLVGGATTNKNLFLSSGLIDLLQPGDLVLADKGFNVKSELAEKGCELATPDFRNSDDIEEVAVASHYHGLVEKVVSRIRTYQYFNNQIINSGLHYSSNYFFIVAFFLNFANPLVLEDDC